MNSKREQGFTLGELAVVVLILAILAAVAFAAAGLFENDDKPKVQTSVQLRYVDPHADTPILADSPSPDDPAPHLNGRPVMCNNLPFPKRYTGYCLAPDSDD